MSVGSKYRVFISYSHANRDLFSVVSEALKSLGVEPWSDVNLAAGESFTEQIQDSIAHCHLFIPILTAQSHEAGWVHQEIGYAVAMKVPCVPVCFGQPPVGMISTGHAVTANRVEEVDEKLRQVNFEQLVQEAGDQWIPPSGCALEPEERAEMIARFANRAFAKIGPCRVRIQGGLTSFSLPDEPPDHSSWVARYGQKPRSAYAYRLFRGERNALAKHASISGLQMIVNCGVDLDRHYGEGVKRTRLHLLVRFLENLSLPDEAVAIALVQEHPPELMTAVGDWFVAESMSSGPVRGVLQTVFTSHAPTISRRVAEFDHRIEALLAAQGSPPGRSKQWAIERLYDLIRDLPPHPAWSSY